MERYDNQMCMCRMFNKLCAHNALIEIKIKLISGLSYQLNEVENIYFRNQQINRWIERTHVKQQNVAAFCRSTREYGKKQISETELKSKCFYRKDSSEAKCIVYDSKALHILKINFPLFRIWKELHVAKFIVYMVHERN